MVLKLLFQCACQLCKETTIEKKVFKEKKNHNTKSILIRQAENQFKFTSVVPLRPQLN